MRQGANKESTRNNGDRLHQPQERSQTGTLRGKKPAFADEGEDRRPKQESTQMWEQCEGQYWQPTACDMSVQGAMG